MMNIATPIITTMMVAVALFILVNFMRTKAIIKNPDGTYTERVITGKELSAGKFEDGDGAYLIEPACVDKRMLFGVIPLSRIFYFRGSSRPIGWHSQKPVANPADLKLIGANELRALWRQERTKDLGRPPKVFPWKMIIYFAVAVVIIVVIAAFAQKLVTPAPVPPGVLPENTVIA